MLHHGVISDRTCIVADGMSDESSTVASRRGLVAGDRAGRTAAVLRRGSTATMWARHFISDRWR
jgi:hypothetical protein